ncbi:phage protease [Anianabacter salinae]|uniref:phage protease n=1 Tax=Anianabacter salinae TaxID=2851023 RepID=UPI00225E6BB6|nr:phage protease [Anianabacter salinae]MBV0912854.1 phage protease [Anianabacter salinae]
MTDAGGTRSICATAELPEAHGAPDWVELLPTGVVRGRDGRVFVVDNPADVAATSMGSGGELPIDYEHQVDGPRSVGPIPAAGWIDRLEVRDGAIWGHVKWTAKAANMIGEREYRYLSPVLIHRQDRRVVRLIGASLVHRPNLNLKALASENIPMTDETDDTRTAAVAEALGLNAEATPEEMIVAINRLATPDPAAYVPMHVVRELMRAQGQTAVSMNEERAEVKVGEAMDAGYLSPAMRDWAVALCTRDPEAFDGFIASAVPVFAHLFETHAQKLPRRSAAHGQGGDAEQIARTLGLPVEKVLG